MQVEATAIAGVMRVETEPVVDERGFFARTFCAAAFEEAGLEPTCAQSSVAFNPKRFTLRGMHYNADEHPEHKLVRCTRGAIYDVVVDLRANSPTRGQWLSAWLTADNHRALYIPHGVAHGYLTVAEDSEVAYQMSCPHRAGMGRGVRWDDPAFEIDWPDTPAVISERDASYALVDVLQTLPPPHPHHFLEAKSSLIFTGFFLPFSSTVVEP
jgi:dTDP-4-dehydrorhamnose 3,5-epimerase